LLTMGIPYSDRFAVLSWSLIPMICSQPIVNNPDKPNSVLFLAMSAGLITLSYALM
jgi:hypothetical protein